MSARRMFNAAAGAVLGTLLFVGATRAQSNSKEIMALEPAQLVALLQKPDASAFEKAKACQRLAVVGSKEAIPALVALLPDPNLNLYARFGLEGIPDPAVDEALRAALATLQGRQLVGVIDSIGQRKDAQAVGLLKGLLPQSDAAVASAAAGALGRIGTIEAAAVLQAALGPDVRATDAVADACLACAEGLAAAGKTAEAAAVYAAVGKAAVPKHVRIAALHGQIRVQPGESRELVLQQLRAEDLAFFRVGLAAVRTLPGADAAAVAGELEKLPPERQALLLVALGDRREVTLLPTAIAATKSDSPAVREAGIVVLARLGDASAITILLDAALSEGGAATQAKEGLKAIAAGDVDGAVLAKLPGADAKAKAVLLEIAAARRISAALPAAREALAAREESLQLAALAALGQLVDQKDLQLLTTAALVAGESPAKKAAQEALQTAALRMPDRDACAAAISALVPGAAAADQDYLLDLLGKLAGKKALAEVVGIAKSSDGALKDAATRVLGEWPNADAADALLEIAKNDREQKFQIRALRGYIRIARQLQLADDVRLAMFRTAMDVARRNDEKKVALDILSRIPSVETLRIAVSYLNAPPLKNDAADAAVKIAAKLVGPEPKAVAAAMQQVVDAQVRGVPGDKAKQLLEQAKANAR